VRSMLDHFTSLLLWAQASLEKEMQLRQALEERLSKESSLTDRPSKEVAATKVLTLSLAQC